MSTLTPKIYYRNPKCTLLPENKIDTVNITGILNSIKENANVHNETIESVKIDAEDIELPIGKSRASTHIRYMYAPTGVDDPESATISAKARVEAYMYTFEKIIALDSPITNIPEITINVESTLHEIERGKSAFSDFPTIGQLSNMDFNLVQWILNYGNPTESSSNWEFTSVNLNPWVNEIVDLPSRPTEADIRTYWGKTNYEEEVLPLVPPKSTWADVYNHGFVGDKHYVRSDILGDEFIGDIRELYSLPIYDVTLLPELEVTKLSDYSYNVKCQLPLRITYIATSKYVSLGNIVTADSYAFNFDVNKINMSFEGTTLNTDEFTITKGLTNPPANKYIIDINADELITQDTKIGSASYLDQMPEILISKYKEGKLIFECTVPAAWAIKNHVHIDTRMHIMLDNQRYISRNNTTCTFAVKNITKRFRDSEFVFDLQLMEV